MNLADMQALADSIVAEYGVGPVPVKINGRLKRAGGQYKRYGARGRVRFSTAGTHVLPDERHIDIARWMLDAPEEEQRETVLHEVAHHIASEKYGENCNHDIRWVKIAIAIGSRGERCLGDTALAFAPPERVYYACGEGCEVTGHRRPRKRYALYKCREHDRRFRAV